MSYNRGQIYGVREVVSSNSGRGTIVGCVFSPTGQPVRFSHPKIAFLSKFWIYLEYCLREIVN